MQTVGIKKGWFIFFVFHIAMWIGLMICAWISADPSNFAGMMDIILPVVGGILMIGLTIWVWVVAYKYHVTFYDTVLEYSNGEKVHKHVAYHDIKKVQFRGVQTAVGYIMPFYDLLNEKEDVLCTIELFMVDIDNLTQLFVERGITVEDKDGQIISPKKRLTGENIHILQENPIHGLDRTAIEKYGNLYNREIDILNKRKLALARNLFIAGGAMLVFGIGLNALSFLVTGIVALIAGGIYRCLLCLLDKPPFLKFEGYYEGGMVYWGNDPSDFIIYSKNGEMKRENIDSCLLAGNPRVHNVNYCMMNKGKEEYLIFYHEGSEVEEYKSKEYKFSEWLANLNYAEAMKIYLLIIFGWNSWFYTVWIYVFGGEKGIAVLGGVLALVSIIFLGKKKWGLLLGLATIIISMVIGLLLLRYSPFATGFFSLLTFFIAGTFTLLCALKATEIPHKLRKRMLLQGIGITVLSVVGIISFFILT